MLLASATSSDLDVNSATAVDMSPHIVDADGICNSAANGSAFDGDAGVVSFIQVGIAEAIIDDY